MDSWMAGKTSGRENPVPLIPLILRSSVSEQVKEEDIWGTD